MGFGTTEGAAGAASEILRDAMNPNAISAERVEFELVVPQTIDSVHDIELLSIRYYS